MVDPKHQSVLKFLKQLIYRLPPDKVYEMLTSKNSLRRGFIDRKKHVVVEKIVFCWFCSKIWL